MWKKKRLQSSHAPSSKSLWHEWLRSLEDAVFNDWNICRSTRKGHGGLGNIKQTAYQTHIIRKEKSEIGSAAIFNKNWRMSGMAWVGIRKRNCF